MRTRLISVTAINLLTAVNDVIRQNRKTGKTATLELPGLRERARLVVAENSLMPVAEVEGVPDVPFTR